MPTASTIAIDGPAASGKSTLGAKLAEKLGYIFVDAGMIYRAVTGELLTAGIDLYDEAAVVEFTKTLELKMVNDYICINDKPLGAHLQIAALSWATPIVAAYGGVRAAVRVFQMEIARYGNIVFAGRDIGTVVLPNADLKIYLEVSLEERAHRRYKALSQTDKSVTYAQVLADLQRRDEQDMTRHESPLKIAPDAIVIDTDNLRAEEVMNEVMQHILIT